MNEVRVVRREDQSLIVATETGEEFRLVVDASLLSDLRHLARAATAGARINPREIQSLIRAGKSHEEIIRLTGADESDIERYEEPVLAERRFILSSAQAVPVRTSPSEESEEQFGTVIAERLIGVSATDVEWSSWRDEEAGWMIGLDFQSHGVDHHAVWSFEHRKGVLSPLTPDAVTLSKQGDVGERLIPKLRAVDATEEHGRFDSDAFDRDALTEPAADTAPGGSDSPEPEPGAHDGQLSAATEAALRAGHPSTGSVPVVDAASEFARRREIDQRAIKTPEPEQPDLGQTADLLDALRKRRGARGEAKLDMPAEWNEDGTPLPTPVPLRGSEAQPTAQPDASVEPSEPAGNDVSTDTPLASQPDTTRRGKGRASIPSWDDILFGTRSEEDPS